MGGGKGGGVITNGGKKGGNNNKWGEARLDYRGELGGHRWSAGRANRGFPRRRSRWCLCGPLRGLKRRSF